MRNDPFDDLDRFGRVVDLRWLDYQPTTPVDVERIKHGYDRASNRRWRGCPVPAGLSPAVYMDEFYQYDGLYPLTSLDRGQLKTNPLNGIDSPTRHWVEEWTFDNTGNWLGYTQDKDGVLELDQTRSHNKANEIGTIGAQQRTPNWADPAHDRAGNMTTIPKPSAPRASAH